MALSDAGVVELLEDWERNSDVHSVEPESAQASSTTSSITITCGATSKDENQKKMEKTTTNKKETPSSVKSTTKAKMNGMHAPNARKREFTKACAQAKTNQNQIVITSSDEEEEIVATKKQKIRKNLFQENESEVTKADAEFESKVRDFYNDVFLKVYIKQKGLELINKFRKENRQRNRDFVYCQDNSEVYLDVYGVHHCTFCHSDLSQPDEMHECNAEGINTQESTMVGIKLYRQDLDILEACEGEFDVKDGVVKEFFRKNFSSYDQILSDDLFDIVCDFVVQFMEKLLA